MKHNIYKNLSVFLLAGSLLSCTADLPTEPDNILTGKIAMNFNISHPSQSRATETAFESGDEVGVFVAEADKILEIGGNTVNNEALTFTGSSWSAAHKLYWDAGTYNVYAYYPRLAEVSSISDLPIEVSTDQRAVADGTMDGYEASDFLFAKSLGVVASASPVELKFNHIMSKLSIRIVKGEDYEGDIPQTAKVSIHNTFTRATVDLVSGVATRDMRGTRKTIIAHQDGPTTYSAIIVPQRLENRLPLIEIEMNGVSFLYESKFLFKPGIHHIVNLVVDKNPEQVKIEVGGEITDWN